MLTRGTMYSDEDLASAVKAGVLSEASAAAFRQHVDELRQSSVPDEEHFRFLTGFNDVFVVIACILLLVSVNWIGATVAFWFGAFLQGASAWGLAEYFARVRRMALPSIVLLLAFVGGVVFGCVMLAKSVGFSQQVSVGLGCAMGGAAAWLHWLRFNVPITVAAGMAVLVFAVVALFSSIFPTAKDWRGLMVFLGGVMVFIIGMRWDASDTRRQTRRFWLHLVAAPLLVHPVFLLLGAFDQGMGLSTVLVIIVLYASIALLSISIDRRAMMVSALAYVLYAFNTLLQEYGVVSLSFAFAALTIGGALLLMSAFWHTCRAYVVGFYPDRVREYLPPLQSS